MEFFNREQSTFKARLNDQLDHECWCCSNGESASPSKKLKSGSNPKKRTCDDMDLDGEEDLGEK